MTTIVDYSEKSFVVRGDTYALSTGLKQLGGKWNPNLKDGPGWIFPRTKETEVRNWLGVNTPHTRPTRIIPNAPERHELKNEEVEHILELLEANKARFTAEQRLQLICSIVTPPSVARTLFTEEDKSD